VGVAWAACLIGFAIGVLGCLMFAGSSKSAAGSKRTLRDRLRRRAGQPIRATRPVISRDSQGWTSDVARAANDALRVIRRLAGGIEPRAVEALAAGLDDLATTFDTLAQEAPPFARNTKLPDQLAVARRGARIEAARLRGVVDTTNDRRAFLGALRALCDAPKALSAVSAVRPVAAPPAGVTRRAADYRPGRSEPPVSAPLRDVR
jgi:hypothetical protein